jgi:hypothetical protein
MYETTVIRVCEFVKELRLQRERTPQEIYFETGYGDCYEEITQQQIEAFISHDSSVVDDWLSFGEDSDRSPGWRLGKHGVQWTVLRVLPNGGYGYSICFSSPVPACALMIRMEMEDLRLAKS